MPRKWYFVVFVNDWLIESNPADKNFVSENSGETTFMVWSYEKY